MKYRNFMNILFIYNNGNKENFCFYFKMLIVFEYRLNFFVVFS